MKQVTKEKLKDMIKNNEDVSNLDVSNITDMSYLVGEENALNFNQDISKWDVSNVTVMYEMFSDAWDLEQDLSGWNVSNVTDMCGMFNNARLFTNSKYFDKTMVKWAKQRNMSIQELKYIVLGEIK